MAYLSGMKGRNVLLSLVLLLLVLVIFIRRVGKEPPRREAFDRHPERLTYTRHARCRMDCRGIDQGEIAEIMEKGIINFSKSNRRGGPCPVFALQGRTAGGESIRVIFAQCPEETRVITCYNLETDFACNCEGDERKRQAPRP
jgi:hypothetical protein